MTASVRSQHESVRSDCGPTHRSIDEQDRQRGHLAGRQVQQLLPSSHHQQLSSSLIEDDDGEEGSQINERQEQHPESTHHQQQTNDHSVQQLRQNTPQGQQLQVGNALPSNLPTPAEKPKLCCSQIAQMITVVFLTVCLVALIAMILKMSGLVSYTIKNVGTITNNTAAFAGVIAASLAFTTALSLGFARALNTKQVRLHVQQVRLHDLESQNNQLRAALGQNLIGQNLIGQN